MPHIYELKIPLFLGDNYSAKYLTYKLFPQTDYTHYSQSD